MDVSSYSSVRLYETALGGGERCPSDLAEHKGLLPAVSGLDESSGGGRHLKCVVVGGREQFGSEDDSFALRGVAKEGLEHPRPHLPEVCDERLVPSLADRDLDA